MMLVIVAVVVMIAFGQAVVSCHFEPKISERLKMSTASENAAEQYSNDSKSDADEDRHNDAHVFLETIDNQNNVIKESCN